MLEWINSASPGDHLRSTFYAQPRDTFHQGREECTGARGTSTTKELRGLPSAGTEPGAVAPTGRMGLCR